MRFPESVSILNRECIGGVTRIIYDDINTTIYNSIRD